MFPTPLLFREYHDFTDEQVSEEHNNFYRNDPRLVPIICDRYLNYVIHNSNVVGRSDIAMGRCVE